MVLFGWTNSHVTFMCLMNNLLPPCLDKFVVVFFGDILLYSKNEEDHVKHLETMLILLREH